MGNVICEYSFVHKLNDVLIHAHGINIRKGESLISEMRWNVLIKCSENESYMLSTDIIYMTLSKRIRSIRALPFLSEKQPSKELLLLVLNSIVKGKITVISKNEIIDHPYPTPFINYAMRQIKILKQVNHENN